jgi:hypothetical protein
MLATVAAWSAAPLPLAEVTPAEDLCAEVADQVKELGSKLESEDAFKEAADKVKQSASLLAVVGQALAEHPDASPLKEAGPTLRDAARQLAAAKDYAEAQAAWPKVVAASEGKADAAAPVEFDWAKLSKMHPAMEEMNTRATVLRRLLRRPKNPSVDSRHAAMIALLAVATHADTHEVKNSADLPDWHAWAVELQQQMSLAATKIKEKDTAAANTAFQSGMETCSKCHDKFQEE